MSKCFSLKKKKALPHDNHHVTMTDMYLLEFVHVLLDPLTDVSGCLQVACQLPQNDGVDTFLFSLSCTGLAGIQRRLQLRLQDLISGFQLLVFSCEQFNFLLLTGNI